MAVKSGTTILLKLATSVVDGTITQNLELMRDLLDATTKDSTGNAKEKLAGELDGTIGVEGKWAENTSNYSVADLYDAMTSGAAVPFIFGGTTTGDLVITGNVIPSNFTWTGPKNEISTWSVNLGITGPTARGTAS
jgi:predicted secreted protein